MLRDPSPIFDTPELPSLRRTKPLPKRRRTSESSSREDASTIMAASDMPPSDATTEASEALVTTESLLALQSYYMPILGGMQELLKTDTEGGLFLHRDHGGGLLSGSRGGINGSSQEDDSGEEDYYPVNFQQPGNTKKRKVPANLGVNGPGHESGRGSPGGEDEPTDRAIPTGRPDHEYDSGNVAGGQSMSYMAAWAQRKKRMSRATLAGLRHKEMLKSRKRQLAAVLGALAEGNTLALDQALSANYPFANSNIATDLQNSELVKVRLSNRSAARLARAYRALQSKLPPSDKPRSFPVSDFEFSFHSATSDRLIATKEEVAVLHARFEAELSRQAAKAAEAAKQTAAVLNSGPVAKRSTKQGRSASGRAPDATKAAATEQPANAPPAKGGKKKKRSALANASNPHHLRNYVPSRLPHSGQISTAQALANAQNLLTPLPIRFLTSDVPTRRRRKATTAVSNAPITNPIEEWICPFCEYDLFYGDDVAYQRAISSRKKILRRRRRARERAAAAASGANAAKNNAAPAPASAPTPATATVEDVEDDEEEDADYPPDPANTGGGKHPPANNSKGVEDRGRGGTAPTPSG